MLATSNPREIAALAPMPELLRGPGFEVNERARRCACILHCGSNRSAFSWTETGLWKCHSCGAGGDRIALVRAVRHCGFREALEFLGQLAGVQYSLCRASPSKIEQDRIDRERSWVMAWRIRDEVVLAKARCMDLLHRTDRLCASFGEQLRGETDPEARERLWDKLVYLAPVQTHLIAEFEFLFNSTPAMLARFVLASPADRRKCILGVPPDGLAEEA